MEAQYGSPAGRRLYRLAMHLTLVVGSIIFAMPFLWLASTSLKEDDEQVTEELQWMPRLPQYQPQSPYIDAREGTELVCPREFKAAEWESLKPALASILDEAIKAGPALTATATPAGETDELLRAKLWHDISKTIPSEKFKDPLELKAAVVAKCTPDQILKSFGMIYRSVVIGDLALRSAQKSAELTHPRKNDDPKDALVWNIRNESVLHWNQAQRGKLIDEELYYKFAGGESRAMLETEVSFADLDTLKAINISHRSDSSWNQLWFAIEFNGKRYESTEPQLLFGKRFVDAIFQLPTPDDEDDIRIHDWITTSLKSGSGFYSEPGKARIELTLVNTSSFTKALDKFSYNYKRALGYIPFWRYFFTSVFLVIVNVVLSIFASSLVAYSFARLNWPGRDICWAILLGTVMIPGQVTMIPSFLIMKWLGWYGTLKPLWVGSAFGGVFFIFMLRQFMKGIPKDLEDAAKIDGCNYWQIYWNVILPLVKPTLAAIGIFTFMDTWNDFMRPLLYLSDQRSYPLSLGLFAFQAVQGQNQTNQGMMMAASLMMTIPVIILFFAAQRHFIQGVTFSGLKG